MTSTIYEMQVSEKAGSFSFTVTTSQYGHYWTSQPIPLSAGNWDDAKAEAGEAVKDWIGLVRLWTRTRR
jgi:hypothetical protein